MSSGVIFLGISVACSVAVSVLLKLARRYQIDVRQSIAVNYAVAALLCWFVLKPAPAALFTRTTPWFVLIALGVLLPGVFVAMAHAVRLAGIVRSDAAQRLSLFISLMAAFVFLGQTFSIGTGMAIAVGAAALFCLLKRQNPSDRPDSANGRGAWLWPLAVWIGYGVIDILFKLLARAGTAFAAGLLVSFVLAGVLITLYLLIRRTAWRAPPLVAGVLLGIVNFANIYTYIRAHQSLPNDPALVFSAMNIGVISIGTLAGAVVFRERLDRLNVLGLVLAVAAIVLMTP